MKRTIKTYGPPGTGKTTRLIERVEEEVSNGTLLPRIGYFSFSRAAKDVIIDRLGGSKNDLQWFRTIHGACSKHLGYGSEGAVMNWRDYIQFSRDTGMTLRSDDNENWTRDDADDFNPVLRALNLSLTTLRPIRDVIAELPDHKFFGEDTVTEFVETYGKWKREHGKFDFMDMLVNYDLDGEPLDIDVAILDEAQDNSPLMWRCFEKLSANSQRVYMAGDDDQAIYTFIGASEYGFLEHECDEEEILHQSYRVPREIGVVADGVIRQVQHRKEKDVQWKDAPGEIIRLNTDALYMPWQEWEAKYCQKDQAGIMVLCRHRREATAFSEQLRLAGVAHALHGETMNAWPEARILHSVYALNRGGSITPGQAISLCKALGKNFDQFRLMGRRDRVEKIDGITENTINYLIEFATTSVERARYRDLDLLVHEQGYEKLTEEAKITVSTMHAAKGRECELVVIVPDCQAVVKQNSDTPTEIRLGYVTLTRTKQAAAFCLPRTDSYITHFD
jgi:DNA helicase-2/ATP-dependent DNA helicase PcrA